MPPRARNFEQLASSYGVKLDYGEKSVDKSVGKTNLVKLKKVLKPIKEEVDSIEASLLMIAEIKDEALEDLSANNNENKDSIKILGELIENFDEINILLDKIKKII
ncbi:hypothetical protein [Vibrio crassostreae]|uniref:hypothetical protein n=1 Tax=Vibrio crassostreae TaxID=246167 RepID=UPI001B31714F|nr:hypothetical protein [Vibrio crassostreae]